MKLILATDNAHKVAECSRILTPLGFEVCTKQQAGVTLEVEETGKTFAENAILKAEAIFQATGLPTLSDDSGLSVDALGGAPGVFSARFGGEGLQDADRNQLLLEKMQGVPHAERTAQFVCVLCLILGSGDQRLYEGTCAGWIATEAQGAEGFGYDPVFMVEEGRSLAMLTATQKDSISHRGQALRLLEQDLAREKS